jgi:hypothetical protein
VIVCFIGDCFFFCEGKFLKNGKVLWFMTVVIFFKNNLIANYDFEGCYDEDTVSGRVGVVAEEQAFLYSSPIFGVFDLLYGRNM